MGGRAGVEEGNAAEWRKDNLLGVWCQGKQDRVDLRRLLNSILGSLNDTFVVRALITIKQQKDHLICIFLII